MACINFMVHLVLRVYPPNGATVIPYFGSDLPHGSREPGFFSKEIAEDLHMAGMTEEFLDEGSYCVAGSGARAARGSSCCASSDAFSKVPCGHMWCPMTSWNVCAMTLFSHLKHWLLASP